ncbi:MAG: hypothetical protein AB1567_01245 [bacterium]
MKNQYLSFLVVWIISITSVVFAEKAVKKETIPELKFEKKISTIEQPVNSVAPQESIEIKQPLPIPKIETIKDFNFKVTGYGDTEIIFFSPNIIPLKTSTEGMYRTGDYLQAKGVYRRDYQTDLNYIDVIKINPENLSEISYLKIFIKDTLSLSYYSYVEVEGEISNILSSDSILIDRLAHWQKIEIDDTEVIYDECADEIDLQTDIITQAATENPEIAQWLKREYGILEIPTKYLEKLAVTKKKEIVGYDFINELVTCTFEGDELVQNPKFAVSMFIKCLYDDKYKKVAKMQISFRKIAKGQLGSY